MSHLERPAGTREPSTIEREMEVTRERLASTIDQLAYRAHPKTIVRREVADIKAFFLNGDGSPRTENIVKVAGAVVGFVTVMALIRKVAR